VFFRNTLAQSSSVLLASFFSFLLTPLMLSRLGLTLFGVWAVTGAIVNYAHLTDLGITSSLSRFVAFHDGHGDRRGIEECLGLGLITAACVATLSGVAALLGAPLLADAVGHLDTGDMRTVVMCAWAMFVVTLLRGALNSVPVGLRRMVPVAVAANVGVLTNFVASVVALLLSRDLVVYALANAGASVVALLATLVAFRSVWRPTTVALPSRERVREILGFGLKSQATWVADQVNVQTDKVIIALIVDVRTAATYEIAVRVVSAVKALGVLTVSAMIPTATAEIVRRGWTVIREYYERYTTRSVAVAFPICVLTCIASPYLFVLWLGDVPENTLLVLVVLTAANFLNVASAVSMTLSLSAGAPGLVASNAIWVAAANLALTAALAPVFGLWGVLAGTFVAISGGTLVFVARFQRRWRIPPRAFPRAVALPAALAIGLALPIVVAEVLIGATPQGRAEAGVATAIVVALYAVPYWLSASRLRILPEAMRYPSLLGRLRGRWGAEPPWTDAVPGADELVVRCSGERASPRPGRGADSSELSRRP
jgi:O-antigen/teichoic acid export membrane protein